MPVKRGMLSQLGVVDETTYGTPVTVTRFFEFRSESIKLDVATIASQGIRAGRYNTGRAGIYARHKRGAGGDVALEIQNKDMSFWLKHMMGAVATTGPVSTAYTHTGTVGSLIGDSFTLQVGRDDQAFTYHGGKVMQWEVSCAVGELATLTLTCDFEDEDTSTGLATASYSTGLKPLSFLEGVLTVGGSGLHVTEATVTGNNNLANERYFIRQSGLKKEPTDQGREYTGTVTAEFEDLVAYNRFVNGTEATLNLKFEGDTISGSEKYTFEIDAPVVRFDGETPNVGGADIIMQPLPFRILDDSLAVKAKNISATP